MSITKDVWLGADNTFTLQFMERDVVTGVETPVDLSSVTKMELYLKDSRKNILSVTTLAADSPKDIDWVSPADTGHVDFTLGVALEAVAATSSAYRCEVQVYDPLNTNGIVWFSEYGRDLTIRVRDKKVAV